MILHRLSLINYKNIAAADLEFSPKINCLIGKNGEGKTNVLDAIYYMSFCHSATSMLDALTVRHDEEYMVAVGNYSDEDGKKYEISCGVKQHKSKKFALNKKAYKRLADHIGLIPLVMVSPNDGELVTGGGEARRKFMDIVISQYDRLYLDSLIKYNRALKQRNAILRADALFLRRSLRLCSKSIIRLFLTMPRSRVSLMFRIVREVRYLKSYVADAQRTGL